MKKFIQSIGPGVFILGYIIGTGSITSMASAGADYSMSLLWALALSCVFTFLMNTAVSRVTILHQKTIIRAIRDRFGGLAASTILVGVFLTIATSIIGLMAIVGEVVQRWTMTSGMVSGGVPSIVTVLTICGVLYALFWFGSQTLFLRAMSLVVAVMSCCFIVTAALVAPPVSVFLNGMLPSIPGGGNASMVLAGMVGTTMATVCLVARSYLVADKGWTVSDIGIETRDSAVALTLTFIVSASVMAAAAGTMNAKGISVTHAMDLVNTLVPVAGVFAGTILVLGIIAAATSSAFPNMLLGPWTIFDFKGQKRQMDKGWVRVFVAIVALVGLCVPLLGGRPVALMIASQAVSPVVMPLLIYFVMRLLAEHPSQDGYRNPRWLVLGLWITLAFSLFVSAVALSAFTQLLNS